MASARARLEFPATSLIAAFMAVVLLTRTSEHGQGHTPMPDSVTLLLSGTNPAFNIALRNTHSQKRANGEKAKGKEGQYALALLF
jgi:hypothetical protein